MQEINCPICAIPLAISLAKGRKSQKPFIMLKCGQDGRHFRGFITDQKYIRELFQEHPELNVKLPGWG